MGQIHHRPDPTTLCPFPSPEELLQQQEPPRRRRLTLDEHCEREAHREIDCWLTGKPYRRRPWKK